MPSPHSRPHSGPGQFRLPGGLYSKAKRYIFDPPLRLFTISQTHPTTLERAGHIANCSLMIEGIGINSCIIPGIHLGYKMKVICNTDKIIDIGQDFKRLE